MTAYFVAIRDSISNPQEMKTYGEKSGPSLAGHSVTPLAVYGRFRVMDGSPIEGAVILAFPTFEEAEAWYDSPAYQDAVQHRFRGAKYQTFIVQGTR
ncbi:DUF1330 domain-containing protein [Bradyrhizobium sp. Ash2021]|uniref:DUF1330 domain-containing protein n=1 Tax=Bradyrhizobium sp. Ash2021 TaxID=2954771 RepID=UPI002816455E|nr:DUF1330 domain-containing protein [Bradyrhizobium sp. Ash2021]WMT72748.1 DUF1330 domain-containing protein [Bradyrhizobium sp. Ash2021]